MTEQEFINKQKEILENIPDEFHGWLSWRAYENGHAYGYGEVLCCLSNLIDGLKELIESFRQNILKNK